MLRPLSEDERTRLQAAQRALQRVIQAPGEDEVVSAEQAKRFAPIALAAQDAEVLAKTDPRRLLVYRKLVRSTLRETIALQIPRTVARMGEHGYRRYLAPFYTEQMPSSRILRDVVYEFAHAAAPRWREDSTLPSYLEDLVRYELNEFETYTAERDGGVVPVAEQGGELAADRAVAFDGTVRVAHYAYAVHRLPEAEDDRSEPAAEATGLLSYRDEDGLYRQMTLSPVATTLLASLVLDGAALGDALRQACAEHQLELDQSVVEATATLLADLADRGALLGPASPGADPTDPHPWSRWLAGDQPAGG